MKPLPMILVVLIAAGTGVAGGWLGSRCGQCSSGAKAEALQADIKPQAETAAKPATREAELAAKVETLERALDALHQDVSELRAGNARTVAVAVEPEKAPIDMDSVAFAAAHKTAIKAVIEEDRAEQARKAEEERKQREIQQTQQRAERTAQRVGLNPAQTKQLEGFYEQQRVRMDEFRGNLQNGGGPTGDPQSMRQTFQEFRTWSENELITMFGSDLAGKIMEEGGGFGMGRGGQAMFGGGGGGGPGGGNATGGGGRRQRAAGGAAPAPVGDGAGAPPAGGGGN